MAKKRADVVVAFPNQPMVLASVATTPDMIVLIPGDGREEHYTYPPDGRFHITEDQTRNRAYFAPGPAYGALGYRRLAIVPVPVDPSGLVKPHRPSSVQTMTIEPPVEREGILEVGILGCRATPDVVLALGSDGARVEFFQGPRSGTTIVFRHLP